MPTMDSLGLLLCQMEQREIVPKLCLSTAHIDDMLNDRDASVFDSHWMAAFDRVESKKREIPLNDLDKDRVSRVSELAYLQSFECWKSPDIAGYISDDFRLISEALLLGICDVWLSALCLQYFLRTFPYGDLKEIPMSLEEIVRKGT